MYKTLINPTELAAALGDPGWRLVDVRFSLADLEKGRRDYEAGHIPGAIYAHLEEDFSGPIIPGRTGRHPLPDIEAFAETLGSWGIGNNSQVVVYDDSGGSIAARLWWMLRWLGHSKSAVLDGGWPAWLSLGLPTSRSRPEIQPVVFTPTPQPDMVADSDEVAKMKSLLVDSRALARYRGDHEPIDPVAGHIPWAANLDHNRAVGPDGRFHGPETLRGLYEEFAKGGSKPIFYCGSGVTACRNILAMEHAGLEGARLYPGSWSEWITDPQRPVARGGGQP